MIAGAKLERLEAQLSAARSERIVERQRAAVLAALSRLTMEELLETENVRRREAALAQVIEQLVEAVKAATIECEKAERQEQRQVSAWTPAELAEQKRVDHLATGYQAHAITGAKRLVDTPAPVGRFDDERKRLERQAAFAVPNFRGND